MSAKAYGTLAPFLWERMAPVPVTLRRCWQALRPALTRAPQESPLEPPLSLRRSRRRQALSCRWQAHGPALMCVLEVEYPLDLWAALPVGGSSCGASVWQREYLYQVHPGRQLKLMKCHQPPHLKQHFLQLKN